mgnify:CR=1 FL=1
MAKRGNPAFVKGQPNPYMKGKKQVDKANEIPKSSELDNSNEDQSGESAGAVPEEAINDSK